MLSPALTQRNEHLHKGQVAQTCGRPRCLLNNIIFAGATGGGRAESPLDHLLHRDVTDEPGSL